MYALPQAAAQRASERLHISPPGKPPRLSRKYDKISQSPHHPCDKQMKKYDTGVRKKQGRPLRYFPPTRVTHIDTVLRHGCSRYQLIKRTSQTRDLCMLTATSKLTSWEPIKCNRAPLPPPHHHPIARLGLRENYSTCQISVEVSPSQSYLASSSQARQGNLSPSELSCTAYGYPARALLASEDVLLEMHCSDVHRGL